MGITTLYAEDDAGIGRDKENLHTITNRTHYVDMAEYNRLKRLAYEMSQALGLGTGATPGSIEMAMRALADPLGAFTGRFRHFADFEGALVAPWVSTGTSGSGAVTPNPNDAITQAAGAGFGNLALVTAAGADVARIRWAVAPLFAGMGIDFRVRFRTPASGGGAAALRLGLADTTLAATLATLRKGSASGWRFTTTSAAGGGTQTTDNNSTVAYAAATWYTLRIVVTLTSTTFYLNDTLVATHTQANALAQATEALLPVIDCTADSGTPTMYVDAVDIRGARL